MSFSIRIRSNRLPILLTFLLGTFSGVILSPNPIKGSSTYIDTQPTFLVPPSMAYPLVDLIPEVDWSSWYQQESGYVPDSIHFGAYVTLPHERDLYIGLGSARPAENSGDGALLARFDGDLLESLGPLTEQGVHDMLWDNYRLHIAGTDPCCGDDWTAGNHYVYTPPSGPVRKYRDPVNGLVEVMHTWGLWVDPDNTIFAAVSSDHTGTPAAEVFSSVDQGVTWTKISDVGGFRAYDILGYGGKLYAIYNNQIGDPLTLTVSEDEGQTWTDVLPDALHRTRLTEFQSTLLTVSADRESIYRLSQQGITEFNLPPGYRVGITYPEGQNYNYNLLEVVDENLFAIWEMDTSGDPMYTIARTMDLQTWESITTTHEELISLSYWPEKHALITSSNGEDAKLWQIRLVRLLFDHQWYLPIHLHQAVD